MDIRAFSAGGSLPLGVGKYASMGATVDYGQAGHTASNVNMACFECWDLVFGMEASIPTAQWPASTIRNESQRLVECTECNGTHGTISKTKCGHGITSRTFCLGRS